VDPSPKAFGIRLHCESWWGQKRRPGSSRKSSPNHPQTASKTSAERSPEPCRQTRRAKGSESAVSSDRGDRPKQSIQSSPRKRGSLAAKDQWRALRAASGSRPASQAPAFGSPRHRIGLTWTNLSAIRQGFVAIDGSEMRGGLLAEGHVQLAASAPGDRARNLCQVVGFERRTMRCGSRRCQSSAQGDRLAPPPALISGVVGTQPRSSPALPRGHGPTPAAIGRSSFQSSSEKRSSFERTKGCS